MPQGWFVQIWVKFKPGLSKINISSCLSSLLRSRYLSLHARLFSSGTAAYPSATFLSLCLSRVNQMIVNLMTTNQQSLWRNFQRYLTICSVCVEKPCVTTQVEAAKETIASLRKIFQFLWNTVQIFLGKKLVNPQFTDQICLSKVGNKTLC